MLWGSVRKLGLPPRFTTVPSRECCETRSFGNERDMRGERPTGLDFSANSHFRSSLSREVVQMLPSLSVAPSGRWA